MTCFIQDSKYTCMSIISMMYIQLFSSHNINVVWRNFQNLHLHVLGRV